MATLLQAAALIAVALITSTAGATRTLGALERYELSTLTYWHYYKDKCNGPYAVVLDAEHYAYEVRPGSFIGKNDGKVVRITQHRIEIIELHPDGKGGWFEKPTFLAKDYPD